MPRLTALILFCLTILGSAAAAQDACSHAQTTSCAEGFVWDAEKGACVAPVTG